MAFDLKQRLNMRIRPTPSGWGFFGLILCTFLISVNFSNNLIFSMIFLLAGICMVGWYHTRTNLKGLQLSMWKCAPVFAGQQAVYRLSVENNSKAGRHGLLAVSYESITGAERHLSGGELTDITLVRSAPQRGRLAPESAMLCSCFPLGIFQARLVTDALPECLVYPAPIGAQALPDKPSGHQAHQHAESGTYKDMRRYAPGDPLSHIHWKAMARFDELYTKEFDGAQGEVALWLRWDDVLVGGAEQKLSQLCRWVLDAHNRNKEYGLEMPGITIEPANEETHLRTCLKALALYGNVEGAS